MGRVIFPYGMVVAMMERRRKQRQEDEEQQKIKEKEDEKIKQSKILNTGKIRIPAYQPDFQPTILVRRRDPNEQDEYQLGQMWLNLVNKTVWLTIDVKEWVKIKYEK